ncbi:hypothetical protein DNTS_018300 [Danionella cerebrum]|uniref:C3H1-type domain-containing protein n=1 Tax=Danionella cerebrum TaxID=2873325 RepID=A0A553QEM5_9TELE|nr:hypothetical protein DNTS_018300 [Danionella translucida]TRY88387.1 hypothetical protein DNTS_018300 [Danionella translucida]
MSRTELEKVTDAADLTESSSAMSRSSVSLSPGAPVAPAEPLDELDLTGDELDLLLDTVGREQECFSSPASSARLPPAFFPSTTSELNSLDSFIKPGRRSECLDELDSIDAPSGLISLRHSLVDGGGHGLDSLSRFSLPGLCGVLVVSVSLWFHDAFLFVSGFTLDVKLREGSPHKPFPPATNGHVTMALSILSMNPLEHTHDFTGACSSCFSSTGSGVLDFDLRTDVRHSCLKDVLLCRRRGGASSPWRRIRLRPCHKNFQAPYELCREVLETQTCKFGEDCSFAYCQEEVDVWTEERRGLLIRQLLLDPQPTNQRAVLGVPELLKMHGGMFMFLCQVCFDSKSRIISKRWKENPALCTNPKAHHQFNQSRSERKLALEADLMPVFTDGDEDGCVRVCVCVCVSIRCLVHALGGCFRKLRAPTPLSELDLCRGRRCRAEEESCSAAHSLLELQLWVLQRDSGINHEEIVEESKKHWNKQQSPAPHSPNKTNKSSSPTKAQQLNGKAGLAQETGSAGVSGRGPAVIMRFVCAQCWRDGLPREPDPSLKYCSAKARHSWSRERAVLQVMSPEKRKWVSVRPLPFAKHFPLQYDICFHVLKQRRCHYNGNCSFAHSQEEKDLWTYMKNNGFSDVQQLFEAWVSSNQNKASENISSPPSKEPKQITMPTDFAELMLEGWFCSLCGKHSNSKHQWQQHITSERHKQRVLSGEGEDESLSWTHRFPGRHFSICPRLAEGCSDGVSCDFAHSPEELQEWCERRDFLRRCLNKARDEMLISPTDNDFGNYNFLLQD